ncbi:MAG: FGGY-family carbohydrate kinase [Pseudanabaena sp. ELA607]
MGRYWLGIDFGTSGVRTIAVDEMGAVVAHSRADSYPNDYANGVSDVGEQINQGYSLPQVDSWWIALGQVLAALPQAVRSGLAGIVIDGTSATVVLCDGAGVPVTGVKIYSDRAGDQSLAAIQQITPQGHLARSATATWPKVYELWQQYLGINGDMRHDSQDFVCHDADNNNIYVMHQADLCGYWLHGRMGITDYHNALKLGYDPVRLAYPDWLRDGLKNSHPLHQQPRDLGRHLNLPQVFAPAQPVGYIRAQWVESLGIAADCLIGAGTTDSTAAFLASIAPSAPGVGMAVTSLGSTMVLKVLADEPVSDPVYGVYSHRWDQDGATFWLVGGASNVGGAVLRQFFSDAELQQLTAAIDPRFDSPLEYYPLPQVGERFPLNDPHLLPQLTPRPADNAAFLHGLLTSMARIEAQGYGVLRDLGAPWPKQIYTTGGGAKNPVWTQLRQRQISQKFQPAPQILVARETEAAYGSALLARSKLNCN